MSSIRVLILNGTRGISTRDASPGPSEQMPINVNPELPRFPLFHPSPIVPSYLQNSPKLTKWFMPLVKDFLIASNCD